MFQKTELKCFKPLLLFWGSYTLLFILWKCTLFYALPFWLGLLLAVVLQPGVDFLQNKCHLSRGFAAGLLTTFALGALLAGLWFLAFYSIRELTAFLIRAAEGGFPEFSPPVRALFRKIGDIFQELDWDILQRSQQEWMDFFKSGMETATTVFSGLMKFLSSLPTLAALLLVTAVSAYLFAKEFPQIKEWVLTLFTPKALSLIHAVRSHHAGTGRRYFLSYALLYFISFCEAFVILYVVGVPYPFLTGLLTCFADILPVFGPGFVFVPTAVYQLLTGAYGKAAGILVGWLIMSALRQMVEPKLVASTIKVHPLAMMAGVYLSLAAGSLWVLIYVLILCMTYSALRGVDALPPIIKPKDPPSVERTESG